MYFLYQNTLKLEDGHTPYERINPDALMRILVAGDSTAVGTGTVNPENSTAGRLAAQYPQAEVLNYSENGLKIGGLIPLLNRVDDKGRKFDIVVIQIGANDIIRNTSLTDIQSGIDQVLQKVEFLGNQVIILHSGDIGEAPFFAWFLRPFLSKRSLEVRDIYIKEVAKYGASYVDLVNSPVAKELKEDPKLYYASDGLHLTDEGYRLWFEEIQKAIK